jgi:hypothetical protein
MTIPAPMPLPTVTSSSDGTLGQLARCSPSAIRLASFSTKTGTPSRSARRSRSG